MILREVEHDTMDEKEAGWVCPKCNIGVAPNVKVCPKCSEQIQEDTGTLSEILLG